LLAGERGDQRSLFWQQMFCSQLVRGAARSFFVTVYGQDRSANRKGAGRFRSGCAHVAEYRQRVLLFPSSESKTIPF
jgi:hypothetical protein